MNCIGAKRNQVHSKKGPFNSFESDQRDFVEVKKKTLSQVQDCAHCVHPTLKTKLSTNKAFLKALGSHSSAIHYAAAT